MESIRNGMAAAEITNAQWVKARASDALNDCVELARLGENEIAVRNSRFPDGPALIFTRSEVVAFLDGATRGEFDGMTV
ncbi:DUF397 domain-containing protein [Streptomyces sp. NBC_00825]|uniref:DUF397 domain-containing protein n=1 Tax=unclassified Streptomyces TaxID=2593676 RepID=UPI002ED0EA82|nr:DUF397 domain-containing protein [Streptomyces sp. NBC_00826]WTH89283.1 DUF397 domain-containing protein [Streptomyces sp. NBC_00825]WTH98008.1 DUF397 domain-containing protein [Streptomyces sp. NBC_00822]